MKDLLLGGTKVCTSFLTQRTYRAACCDLLLPVTHQNQKTAIAHFAKVGVYGPYSGLRISGIADLSFLRDFPNLLYLEVVDQKKVDVTPLHELSNLRGLRLETPGKGLDFGQFPHLESSSATGIRTTATSRSAKSCGSCERGGSSLRTVI
jgi:hypothetical protein